MKLWIIFVSNDKIIIGAWHAWFFKLPDCEILNKIINKYTKIYIIVFICFLKFQANIAKNIELQTNNIFKKQILF